MAESLFCGETFEVDVDLLSDWDLTEYAAATYGPDGEVNEYQGRAALLRLVLVTMAPKEQTRFRQTARAKKATLDDLIGVFRQVVEARTDRPTGRPSDSSAGPPATAESSAPDYSLVQERLERDGRPDLALIVHQAAQAS